jgi:hypothetical protein
MISQLWNELIEPLLIVFGPLLIVNLLYFLWQMRYKLYE